MVLSPLGGSGKTYRLANNLTIDYQDVGELETLWTNQVVSDKEVMQIIAASAETMELHAQTPFVMDAVSTSQTAMDAVSTSSTAMDAVSTSQTAMDAVSTSSTARDAIGTDGADFDAIAAVPMAIGKFAAGIAGLNPTTYADIDAVASSQTAMDAVSTSSTARDAIGTDGVGFDAIAAVPMAIGKFAAGIAGLNPTTYADIDAVASSQTAMDAVSTSSTAMDAVSTSSTAMDAVSASLLAYSAVFKSDHSVSSLWASTPGAKTILQNSGNKSLPFNTSTPGGDANITVDDGSSSGLPGSTAHQLHFDINGADGDDYVSITFSLDLSGSDTLELKEKAEGLDQDRMKLGVKIDGTQVFEIGGTHGYTTRSLDISTFNGTHDVEFYHDNNNYTDDTIDNQFYIADIDLI